MALDIAEIPCISNNVSNVDEVDIHPPLTLPNMRLGQDRIISAFSRVTSQIKVEW